MTPFELLHLMGAQQPSPTSLRLSRITATSLCISIQQSTHVPGKATPLTWSSSWTKAQMLTVSRSTATPHCVVRWPAEASKTSLYSSTTAPTPTTSTLAMAHPSCSQYRPTAKISCNFCWRTAQTRTCSWKRPTPLRYVQPLRRAQAG